MNEDYKQIGNAAKTVFKKGGEIRLKGRGNFARIAAAFRAFWRDGKSEIAEMIAQVYKNMNGKHVWKKGK